MLSQSNQYLGAFPSVATAVSVVQCVCVCFVLVLMRLPPPCPVCVFSVKCIRSAAGSCVRHGPGSVLCDDARVHAACCGKVRRLRGIGEGMLCDVDGGDCAHSTPCGQVTIENVRVHFILLILIHARVAVSKPLGQE